ncbi:MULTISPECIES: maleylpyruvate isomerase family mycothiol-dependent enzyme [unclassified Mycolicibacterium]|uniref:maleylpyruvate isomerase family mycothiol-dependent enzyme n=1 Tax=unclassified Mycolicibacterium TaxID=2636767 RepID=UPI00130B3D65|nr:MULTISPECIES: maleylpyruvate isomerase family mycothiol-dependent enzyme [unclassified Mycolicibacterium]MUL82059.1 maleylpyruvate isomerase family mycothiol-dependent enzyme [Mycolicibacterium sp. CBMA 329]MUL87825.1 maleylpyruvate isomerase family mycothiol-dependent enzyme [Mycolicibacterium sp. CBMA 331]MUM01649.1 maleylpyruvate isomerase family mycothiol-dependent enzyme [Mycolicibacterium sp. CBMA 334]MUM25519.1 maleylpyruvate isomerase family mycothiol-dependent enzyme [Mycolicibacter
MDFRAALLDQTRAFGELIASNDPQTPVPTCPDWTFKQLFRHVGRGNRWAAQIISERRVSPLGPQEVHEGRPPDDPDAALDWLNAGAVQILKAVDQIGTDARVWTFLGPKPAGWWIRRRVHEVAVHRADAALAVGADFDLPAEFAADAVSEWLEIATATATKRHGEPLASGVSVHLHATDDGLGPTGEWTVANDEDGLEWSHIHGKGSVALRGPARDLLLAATRRRSAADLGLEVFGDTAIWDAWLDRTPF